MTTRKRIRGILFDLDGVLYIDTQPIPGAAEAVRHIKEGGWACRFVTNTSTLALGSLHRKLCALGLPIERHEIISAPQAALRYLLCEPSIPCCLLMQEDVRADFVGLHPVDLERADVIVLGDLGDRLDYPLLNRIFNRLMQGARLVAIHRNRFWQTEDGLRMDIGGFVAALEYCSGRAAVVMGKPSPDFFRVALADLGFAADEVLLVGDDIDSDIGGAQAVGIAGVLVRTGKFRQEVLDASTIEPDAVIDTIRDLPTWLSAESS